MRHQIDQFDQLKQLKHAKYGAALRDGQEGIGRTGIRPGQRNRARVLVLVLEINELTTPALAITEQLKLTLIERVKRMRDREVPLQLVHMGCSYTLILLVANDAAFAPAAGREEWRIVPPCWWMISCPINPGAN